MLVCVCVCVWSVFASHSIFEKELRALALALQECLHLVTAADKLIIECDNLAAVFSTNANKTKRPITPRAIKYLNHIQTYSASLQNSTLIHISTHRNVMADCLSRLTYDKNGDFDFKATDDFHNSEEVEFDSICSLFSEIEMEVDQQPHARDIDVTQQITISPKDELKYLEELHEQTHWSASKTKNTLKTLGHNVNASILNKIWADCATCGKFRQLGPSSKLNPHAVTTSTPLERVHIDHVDMSSRTSVDGKCYIISLICDLTKFIACKATDSKGGLPVIRFLEEL